MIQCGKIKPLLALLASVIFLVGAREVKSQVEQGEPLILGQSFTFQSDVLNRAIPVAIHLPPAYHDLSGRYPVLLVFVGNQFSYASGVVDATSRSNVVPATIVVDLSGCDSKYFIPTPSSGGTAGLADSLLVFLQSEFFPWLDSTYRTQPFRILYGSDWGGIFCLYAVLSHPGQFDAALAASPWFIYDDEEQYFLTEMPQFIARTAYDGNYIFCTVGDEPEIVPSFMAFADSLQLYAPPQLATYFEPMPKENHATVRDLVLYRGLLWLYEPWRQLPAEVIEGGETAIREYARSLHAQFGYEIGLSITTMVPAADYYKTKGDSTGWISILRLNTEFNADAPYAHWALGRALEDMGQEALALESLRKAADLAKKLNAPYAARWREYVDRLQNKMNR